MTFALSIFGRTLVAGRTKTRLIPELGADGACAVYAGFVTDALAHTAKVEGALRDFWTADDAPDAALERLLGNVPRQIQPEGDLGMRMRAAAAASLAYLAATTSASEKRHTMTHPVYAQSWAAGSVRFPSLRPARGYQKHAGPNAANLS